MNATLKVKSKSLPLSKTYQTALCRYVAQGSSRHLKSASRFGRRAVSLGLGLLDLALIHEQARISQALPASVAARGLSANRARAFFAEAVIPMEKKRRMATEDSASLRRLNRILGRRTSALAASNIRLKKEITRRKALEETLRQNERHSRRLLEQSRNLQSRLRLLSRCILSMHEEERKKVSRHLHDVIGQMLTGVNFHLASLKSESAANTGALSTKILHTQKLVEKSVDIVHRFASELRPSVLDDLGLVAALHSFMKSFSSETGIRVELSAFSGADKLSDSPRLALYRVAHEALTNAARHSKAARVEVKIRQLPDAVSMDISDDGEGFEVRRGASLGGRRRMGLMGIQERVEMIGGKFSIASQPGAGTTIHAEVPFSNGKGAGQKTCS